MIAMLVVCVLVILGGGVAIAALVLDAPLASTKPRPPQSVLTWVAGEREFAAALAWTPRFWFALRATLLGAALLVALSTKVPAVMAIALVGGVIGPRLLLGSRAETRRIKQARAFVTLLRQFASRLDVTNEPFDSILLDIARNAPPELSFLTAAVGAQDVVTAFRQAVDRARSPLLERGFVTLLVSRTRDRTALSRLLIDHEIPQLEGEIEEAEEIRAVKASQNATIVILAGTLLTMFAFLNGVDAVHAVYTSAFGSVVLVAVVLVFTSSVVAMKALLRQPKPLRWDLERVSTDLGRMRNV
jgi:hypothetical protein